MIEFQAKHKSTVEWFDQYGHLEQRDVRDLSDNELFELRAKITRWCNDQLAIIDAEINNWSPIYCAVCGEEDLAFRGRPFITWQLRAGKILCPRHVMAYDRLDEPKWKQRKEEAEIKALFG